MEESEAKVQQQQGRHPRSGEGIRDLGVSVGGDYVGWAEIPTKYTRTFMY